MRDTMSTKPTVIIAGHGQMGRAMESLLQGRAVLCIWPITPERPQLPDAVRAVAAQAGFFLACVPTMAHAAVLEPMVGCLPSTTAVLSIAKGIDDSGRCAADLLQTHHGARPWGVFGGPMIANEIIAGKSAFAELGTEYTSLVDSTRRLFPGRLKFVANPHPRAVSWCGVLKNVYAPLVGIADELAWGDNVRGHLIMAALAEMHSLLAQFAGVGGDVYGDAGLGDFATTVTSASSHHYALGRHLARGELVGLECEAVHSLRVLHAQGRTVISACPLFSVAAGLAQDPASVPDALHAWLTEDDSTALG